MANPILNLGNNEWATKSESLLGYSKSGSNFKSVPFTHSRESIGATIDRNGVLQTEAGNIPRIDFKDNIKGSLLLEPQRTNLLKYSEDFTNAVWSKTNTTIISDDTISPSGELNADKFARTSTSGSWMVQSISKGATATTYTTSAFIKKGSDNYFAARAQGSYPSRLEIRFSFDTEEIFYAQTISAFVLLDYGVENYANDWYRIYFTYTTDTHTSLQIHFSPRATSGNIDNSDTSSSAYAYIWGAQTELGTYASSYISTGASSVTRLKDTCLNAGNSNLFNDSEGTLFLDVYDFKSSVNPEITLSNGSATNRITLVHYPSSNQLRFYITSNNVVQADQFVSYTYSQRNKIALRYKQNDFKAYINGTQVFSDTSGNTPIGLSRFDFSKYDQTNGFLEGEVYQTMIFNEALSDSELQTLTTL